MVVLLVSSQSKQPPPVVDAAIPPTAAQPSAAATEQPLLQATVRYQVSYSTVVANTSSATSTGIKLEVPLISARVPAYQSIVSETFSPRPSRIETLADGSRIAHFDLGSLAAGQSVTVRRHYVIEVWPYADGAVPDDHAAGVDAEWGGAGVQKSHLQPAPGVESDHEGLVTLARNLSEGTVSIEQKIDRIHNYVRGRLSYNLNSKARNQGAVAGWLAGEGVCTEFAGLFAALARAVGIPTRLVNGRIEQWALNGGKPNQHGTSETVRHQWTEFFHPVHGWVPVDPTLDANWRDSLRQANRFAENHGDRSTRGRFRGGQLSLKTTVTVERVIP